MLDKLFAQFDSIIFLDVETSGLDFKQDEIIEFGAVRVCMRAGEIYVDKEIDLFVRLSAGKLLPSEITKLTSITQSDLDENGVSKSEVCKAITEILGTDRPLVVAYNAQFDLCFLYYLLSNCGQSDVLKRIKMLDALTVYKDRRDYPHKLENAVEEYKLETKSSHRAIDDAIATYSLLCAMDKEDPDLEHYINLFGYNPKYGISGPKINSVKYVQHPYGKHEKVFDMSKNF